MTASLFVIVNPASGGGKGLAVWQGVLEQASRGGLTYEFEITRAPLTATSFVRQALRAGARTIVAVGGDGTASEAINGFFLDGRPIADDATLCLVPAGRVNDLAASLGIPRGAAGLSLLTSGQQRKIDLAVASFADPHGVSIRSLFANSAVVGGDPMPMPSPPHFGAMGWTGRFRADDGDELWVQARRVLIALGPHVGGRNAAPRAKVDDGLIDLVIESPPSGVPKDLMTAGREEGEPDARARKIHLEMDGVPPIELDGERVGVGGVDVEILPAALSIYVTRP